MYIPNPVFIPESGKFKQTAQRCHFLKGGCTERMKISNNLITVEPSLPNFCRFLYDVKSGPAFTLDRIFLTNGNTYYQKNLKVSGISYLPEMGFSGIVAPITLSPNIDVYS
jgi:hypothetical protein